MRLVCKRREFPDRNPRSSESPFVIPLTVGKSYMAQVVSRLDRLANLSAVITEKFMLVVFTDNQAWEEIEIPADRLPEETERMNPLNQQLQSVFEDPT